MGVPTNIFFSVGRNWWIWKKSSSLLSDRRVFPVKGIFLKGKSYSFPPHFFPLSYVEEEQQEQKRQRAQRRSMKIGPGL